jgi:hypothetical protein
VDLSAFGWCVSSRSWPTRANRLKLRWSSERAAAWLPLLAQSSTSARARRTVGSSERDSGDVEAIGAVGLHGMQQSRSQPSRYRLQAEAIAGVAGDPGYTAESLCMETGVAGSGFVRLAACASGVVVDTAPRTGSRGACLPPGGSLISPTGRRGESARPVMPSGGARLSPAARTRRVRRAGCEILDRPLGGLVDEPCEHLLRIAEHDSPGDDLRRGVKRAKTGNKLCSDK